jgi:hypothetical protein
MYTRVSSTRAVLLATAALLLVACDAAADELAARAVVVRLYDTATSDPARRAAAMRGVTSVMSDAGITVDWRDCSQGGDAHPCRTVRGEHDLVVRIMSTVTRTTTARDDAGARDGDSEERLGFAAMDPAGRGNGIATIYYDRVLRVARRAGLDAGDLLGRAMAHEIGHLLLRAPGHNHSGLMRALWTDAELTQNRRDDWTFAENERQRLQSATRRADPETPADDLPDDASSASGR